MHRSLIAFMLYAAALIAAAGDILALRVVGSTTLVTDVLSACNVPSACSGSVLEIDIDGLATGGTYALGIASQNGPASATIQCSVSSPGYTPSALTTTINRAIYGTRALRRVYNVSHGLPYPSDQTLVSSTLTLRIALSDLVYSGDTLNCFIGPGLYTQGGTPTAAFSGAVTNNSNVAHSVHRVVGNWSESHHLARINSALAGDGTNNADGSITLRAVAFHRHAANGKPVAAVVFSLTDGTTTITATATDMVVSELADSQKVLEYQGRFTSSQLATLTQGATLTANFAAYPWVGDSGAVQDTAAGTAQPSSLPGPINLVLDRTGAYPVSAAYVDPATGNDTTCVAVAEAAYDPNSRPAACATLNGAAVRIRARNLTNGRGDAAGTIFLAAGNHVWTGGSTAISGTAATWLRIRPDPLVGARVPVIIGVSGTSNLGTGTRVWFDRITLNNTSAPPTTWMSTSTNYVKVTDCSLTSGSTTTFFVARFDVLRSTINATCGSCLRRSSTARVSLIRGNVITTQQPEGVTTLGNTWGSGAMTINTNFSNTQPIIAFNVWNGLTSNAIFYDAVTLNGIAIVQNVWEYISAASNPLLRIGADSSLVTQNNVILWHNTTVGQRNNLCYNDDGSAAVFRSAWSVRGNIFDSWAVKSDTFNTPVTGPNAGRVGNWQCLYGIGASGNLAVEPTNVGVAGGFQHEFIGLHSDFLAISSTSNTQADGQPPFTSTTRSVGYPQFVNRAAYNGSLAGAGNGNYRIAPSSPAVGLIPASLAVLPFDLDGKQRVGSAGAYEGPSSSPTRRRVRIY